MFFCEICERALVFGLGLFFWYLGGSVSGMYRKMLDASRGLAVFRMGGPSVKEWEEHFLDLDEVARWSSRLGFRAAIIVAPGAGFELPDARRRAELSKRTTQPGYDPYVALLHPNGVARGLLTMLQWMRGNGGSDHQPFGTELEALTWLEKQRGEPLPELRSMLLETTSAR